MCKEFTYKRGEIISTPRNFLYRNMKCGRICLSHGGQLPVLHRRKGSQHFMNQAKFHSTFPILLLLKSLLRIKD